LEANGVWPFVGGKIILYKIFILFFFAVANKWQHIYGQEYMRPCELKPDFPLFEDEARNKNIDLF
jgi:hypothetical protein